MPKTLVMTALLAVAALTGTAAPAATLVAGVNNLTGTTLAAEPQLAGTVVVDEINGFSFAAGNGTFSGSVQSRVTRSVDGTYDFDWRIFNTAFTGTGGAALSAFRIGAFGNLFGVNANYRNDGLGAVGPDNAYVFPYNGFVNFRFSDGLRAGSDSKFFFLDTNATSYAKTAIFDLTASGDTGISGAFATYAPGSAVPEPASWAMMIVGFGLAGASLRLRRVRLSDPRGSHRPAA